MDEPTVTGRLLQEAQKDIEDVIKANNLSKTETTLLTGQKLILKFIEEDHAKTKTMYEDYTDRRDRRKSWEKFVVPITTSLIIIFLTQALYFWVDVVPKLRDLP